MVVWSKIFKYTVTSLIFDIQKCANNIFCFKLDFAPDEIIKLDIYIMLICIRVRVTAQKNACNLLRLNLRMIQSGLGDSLYLFHFLSDLDGVFCIATPHSTSTGIPNFRALSLSYGAFYTYHIFVLSVYIFEIGKLVIKQVCFQRFRLFFDTM